MTFSRRKQLVKTTYFWWKQTRLLRISHRHRHPYHDTLQHAQLINRPPLSALLLSALLKVISLRSHWFSHHSMLCLPFSSIAIEKRRGNMPHDLPTGWSREYFRHTRTKTFAASEAADMYRVTEAPRVKKQLKKPRMKWKMAAKYGWLTSERKTAIDIVGNTWTRLSVNWS